ncbi:DNA polymerase II [Pseudoalteromonas phenolica]|uniref:DNA polymerase n=1 Tax=Pseudoalteromonas phenolica TaxID=161398 RepID=A0A5R9PXR9_9GAMM|nr:DNA polymerase II [Pseudoalteromonas phenolica]TLX45641.1 DNA polymerase II [Pseudoalteromonas phenolica]
MAQAVYEGFILSRQQFNQQGKLCLCYWLMTSQGPAKVIIPDQQSVFFIRHSDVAQARSLIKEQGLQCDIKPLSLKHFDGEPVAACYFSSNQHLFQVKQRFSLHMRLYEDDIRHCDRYLMERFIKGGVWVSGKVKQRNGYIEITDAKLKENPDYKPNLSMLSLDIECDGQGVLFSVGLVSEHYKSVIMIGAPQQTEQSIIWVEDEIELLQVLMQQVKAIDPDVIIGWNVIEFDFVVLAERAEALGMELCLGRDNASIDIYKGNYVRVLISGRVVIDGIDTMKNATYHFPSFSLANVASEILGEQKLIQQDNRLSEIIRQFNEDKLALAAYNLQDCMLVMSIFKKLNLLEFAIVRTQMTGLELEKMGGSVAAFINLYLPLLHRSGYIAPNLAEHGVSFESPGGYVMESKPGLYKNVLVLDFKSLYPSIIRTFFIDPLGLIKGLENQENALEGFNGGYFSTSAHHLPQLVEQLSEKRQNAKEQGDAMLSQAIKIIMNSLYGVLGSKGCRFYDPRLSSSITLRGHKIMLTTRKYLESWGYEVIYGDTDSTFVALPEELTGEQSHEIGKVLQRKINQTWSLECEERFGIQSHLEIEFETHYSPFFMPTIRGQETGSKKRYVGRVEKDGQSELVFKGMETVRSDWTDIAKLFQKELVETLFSEGDLESVAQKYIEQILSGENDHLLIYKKRLGKPLEQYVKNIPPHVRAAKTLPKSAGITFCKGTIINYYISKSGPTAVLSNQDLQQVDYEHYIQKQIMPILNMFQVHFNAFNFTSKQHTLFDN